MRTLAPLTAVSGTMTSVVIHHPHASLLSALGETWSQVVSGKWSIAARLCSWHGDRILDLDGACAALDAAARRSGLQFHEPAPEATLRVGVDAEKGIAILTGEPAIALSALDLFSRVLCGQWRVLIEHARLCQDGRGGRAVRNTHRPDDLGRIRNRYGRVAALGGGLRIENNEWPAHPLASLGIAEGPLAAQVAYHAFKALGGGSAGGPTFSLPDGPLYVVEDGVRRSVPGAMGRLL